MAYRELPASAQALETEVLELWREERTFRRSLERREASPEFVFFEGPPTANGRPGVHHVIARTIKDLVARHRTMTGHHVTRIAGWDTHGLPVEIEAERQLGISGKPEIEALGIARFNRVCRENLFTYKEEWERLSRRIGYWLDYDRAYVTCSPEYVESVWWALREIDRKGLLYRGHRIVPYCPRCGTGLSSHEVALGYAEREDPSLHVLFPVSPGGEGGPGEPAAPEDGAGGDGSPERYLLVWTTTPWTLVSNVAVAYGPDLDYVEVEEAAGRRVILAKGRVSELLGDQARVVRPVTAAELRELRYRRPLSLYPEYPEATGRLYAADFVSDAEGTGLVHVAPAFGEDDFQLGQREGLPVVHPVDDAGRFVAEVEQVGGRPVKEADPILVDRLEQEGLVFRSGTVRHSYPHCWRCDSPLIYMARDSWYVRTTAVKERLERNNAAVDWHPPEIGSGRMGEWLANNVDWALSRDRYWGTPLPVWECDRDREHREVIGSYEDLRSRAEEWPEPFDPHRPVIDGVTWSCGVEGCGGTMRRVPEVMDAWFDSGSMPYAQWHYPFEGREDFETHFPADFIAEGVDQTRGWFYSLLALSTILFEQPAYRAVVVNDLILDAEGQKMSKSRGNVVDPWEAIEGYGADVIRFYLLSVSNPWLPKRWDPEGLDETRRKLFDTLHNTYRFFSLYANLEGWTHGEDGARPLAERPVMDRWLLGRLDRLADEVGGALEAYDPTPAARSLATFVVDDLSNWYVRRCRDRFWATGPEDAERRADTRDAFATLHEALQTYSRLLAPLAPFVSDWLHRQLTDGASVHLADFPTDRGRQDGGTERQMEDVRQLAALGRAARERAGLRVRQPLRRLEAVIPGGRRLGEEYQRILAEELNVKGVEFSDETDEIIRLSAKPEFGRLGPRFGSRTPSVAKAIEALEGPALRRLRAGEEVEAETAEGSVRVRPEEVRILEEARGGRLVAAEHGYLVALDAELDEELVWEGTAREIVSRVQRLRRDAGLEVADRIRLAVVGAEPVEAAARAFGGYIAGETLAVELRIGEADGSALEHVTELDIEGDRARIGLERVEHDAAIETSNDGHTGHFG